MPESSTTVPHRVERACRRTARALGLQDLFSGSAEKSFREIVRDAISNAAALLPAGGVCEDRESHLVLAKREWIKVLAERDMKSVRSAFQEAKQSEIDTLEKSLGPYLLRWRANPETDDVRREYMDPEEWRVVASIPPRLVLSVVYCWLDAQERGIVKAGREKGLSKGQALAEACALAVGEPVKAQPQMN